MRALNWLLLLPIVESCGVAIHLELVDRVLPLLPRRIAVHYNYIRSGAFYPDAFYNCMGQYDVAEDAHWPPFLAKAVDVVRYRQSRGEDTSKLEAFLVGILSHQVSDVSWHSLGVFQGLLRAMAENEFDGNYNEAHSVLDIGGDMIHLSRRVIRQEKTTDWEYDVQDILAILEANGYTSIPATSIRYCMARGHAAYSAELKVAELGFKRYARRSPLLFDKLESYFVGGMTDMHEQIEQCLPQVFNWFASGASGNPWEICQVFEGAQLDHAHPMISHEIIPESEIEAENIGDRFAVSYSDSYENAEEIFKRGSYFSLKNLRKVAYVLADLASLKKDKILHTCHGPKIQSFNIYAPALSLPEETTVASLSQPSFGQSLLFWGSHLVVGAPSEGKVYVYNNGTGIFDNLVMELTGSKRTKRNFAPRFGAALVEWGKYLIVSSPGASKLDIFNESGEWSGGIIWEGASIQYGSRGVKLVGETLAVDHDTKTLYVGAPYVDFVDESVHINRDGSFDYTDGIDRRHDQAGIVFSLSPEILLRAIEMNHYELLNPDDHIFYRGEKHYEKAGARLLVTQQWILVGSPGISRVHGFDPLTGKLIMTLSGKHLHPNKPSGFGGYLLAGDSNQLVVGSPAGSVPNVEGNVDENQRGVVSIFKHRRAKNIEGSAEFDWFGSNGVIVGRTLFAASPHASSGQGMLWQVNMETMKTVSLGNVRNSFASGFGSSIASNGKVLAIGMPNYGLQTKEARRGAVAIVPIV